MWALLQASLASAMPHERLLTGPVPKTIDYCCLDGSHCLGFGHLTVSDWHIWRRVARLSLVATEQNQGIASSRSSTTSDITSLLRVEYFCNKRLRISGGQPDDHGKIICRFRPTPKWSQISLGGICWVYWIVLGSLIWHWIVRVNLCHIGLYIYLQNILPDPEPLSRSSRPPAYCLIPDALLRGPSQDSHWELSDPDLARSSRKPL